MRKIVQQRLTGRRSELGASTVETLSAILISLAVAAAVAGTGKSADQQFVCVLEGLTLQNEQGGGSATTMNNGDDTEILPCTSNAGDGGMNKFVNVLPDPWIEEN